VIAEELTSAIEALDLRQAQQLRALEAEIGDGIERLGELASQVRGLWRGAAGLFAGSLAAGALGPGTVAGWARAAVEWVRASVGAAAATNVERRLAAEQALAEVRPLATAASFVITRGNWDEPVEGWGLHSDAFRPAGTVYRAERLKSGSTSVLPPVLRPTLEYRHRFGVHLPFAPDGGGLVRFPFRANVNASDKANFPIFTEYRISLKGVKGPFTLQDGGAADLATVGLTGAHPWPDTFYAWIAAPFVTLMDTPDAWPAGVARGLALQLPTVAHCALRLDEVVLQFQDWRRRLFYSPTLWPVAPNPPGLGWFNGRIVGAAPDTSNMILAGATSFTLATAAIRAVEEGFRRFFASRRVLLEQAPAASPAIRNAMRSSADPDLRRAEAGQPVVHMPGDWPSPFVTILPREPYGKGGTRPAGKPKPQHKNPTNPRPSAGLDLVR